MFKKFIAYYRPHKKIFVLDMLAAFLIAVIEDGKIVEMGTHNQLLKKKGSYRILHDLQFRLSKHKITNQ